LPFSNEGDEEVALKLTVKHLTEEVQVGDECGLQDDWNVRGVEKLNRIRSFVTSNTLTFKFKFNSKALEVDDDENNEDCCEQVRNVWSVLTPESLL